MKSFLYKVKNPHATAGPWQTNNKMTILELSFKDAPSSSSMSTVVSNQMAEWWQTLRLWVSVDSVLSSYLFSLPLTNPGDVGWLIAIVPSHARESFLSPDTNIFCLSLKAKSKVSTVIVERGITSLFSDFPCCFYFSVENRKKKKFLPIVLIVLIGRNFGIPQSNPLLHQWNH